LSSAIGAEDISVSNLLGKNRPVQNPIPNILVIIIARLAWTIYFFAEIVAGTKQEEAAFPSLIMSVKNVRAMRDSSE
jgi:hypothetical protein